MTVGQWFGQWFGSWYGSGEPAPEGSLSGATTLGLSGTATLTGTGAMAGTASVSLASNGTLTTGAAGSLAGTAAFSIAATGTASSASLPVGTGEYPFFSEGFWSAGFFSDGFWGQAAEELEAIRRPRTNIRLRPIREARTSFAGVRAKTSVGQVCPRVVQPTPVVIARRTTFTGVVAATRTNGTLSAHGAANTRLTPLQAKSAAGTLSARAGSRARISGVRGMVRGSPLRACGGSSAPLLRDYGAETFVGQLRGRGVQNPTDEQLAFLVATILR